MDGVDEGEELVMEIGDNCSCGCPTCGKEMNTSDLAGDGCLKVGFVDNCQHCGAQYEIDSLDWSATIWVKRVETAS